MNFSFQDINSISFITKSNVDEEVPVTVVDEEVPVTVVEPETVVEEPSKFLIVVNYDKTKTSFPIKNMKADIFTIENNKYTTTRKSKWENILWFLSNYSIWKKYEYLWFPDDNIRITEEEIMTYLNIVDENEMKISQPSIYKSVKNKSHVHKVLLHNSRQSFRKSHFIENKLVCFKRTYVEDELVPFLKQNEDWLQSGWGLDIWWSSTNKNSMYIVDKIKVETIEEENSKKNDKGFAEMKHYITKYKLRLKI